MNSTGFIPPQQFNFPAQPSLMQGSAVQPMATANQGLMPSSMMATAPQTMTGSVPSLMNFKPGPWSQLAYQMAGSPNQGPRPRLRPLQRLRTCTGPRGLERAVRRLES